MRECFYESEIIKLLKEYMESGHIDQDKLEAIGYRAYTDTHISYFEANIDDLKDRFVKEHFKGKSFSEQEYDKISNFFKTLKNSVAIGYTKRCAEESETAEGLLYNENVLPELLESSRFFKDTISNDFFTFNEIITIDPEPKKCQVFEEIERSHMPEQVKMQIHKAHNRLHYITKYFYDLIKDGVYYELYGLFWRMRYLNILIVTAIVLFEIENKKENIESNLKLMMNILDKAHFGAFILKLKDLEDLNIDITYENEFFRHLIDNKQVDTLQEFLDLTDEQINSIKQALKSTLIAGSFQYTSIQNVRLKSKPDLVFKLNISKLSEEEDMLFILEDTTEESRWITYLEELAIKDPLTGICNRRCMEKKLIEYMDLSKRYERPLSVIMCDVDFFKKINDTYGHDIGDKVLKAVAELLNKNSRSTDIVSRYGGEEFVIISPETNLEQARLLAEKLRVAVENLNIDGLGVTCSFGVATFTSQDTKETLIKRADENLYKAKQSGRNMVVA